MIEQDLVTPIGRLRLVAGEGKLLAIQFEGQYHGYEQATPGKDIALSLAVVQLAEYFAGDRQTFSLPLAPQGTSFQRQVWSALLHIPFGEVRSYAQIAQDIGNPRAVRAVGAANGRNPLPIVVPCHRVVGSDGRLTGFAGGLAAKASLLALEGVSGG